MGRRCKTCEHPRRAEIEIALSRHTPLDVLAKRFEIGRSSLHRHKHEHMPPELTAKLKIADQIEDVNLEALRRRESDGVLQNIIAQRGRLYRLSDAATQDGDVRAAVAAENAILKSIEITAKIVGEIAQANRHVSINFLGTDSYHLIRTALMQSLKPYPEAARAVATALQEVEAQAAQAPLIEGRAA